MENLSEKDWVEGLKSSKNAKIIDVRTPTEFEEGYIEEENIEVLQDLIASSVHSKLLFYLKRRNNENLDDMISRIEKEIRFLIN